MMNKLMLTLGLTAALAACTEDHTIVADGTPKDDFNAAAEGNIVLPPSIQSSRTYRCADNTLVKVDWLSDGKSATVSMAEGGTPVLVSTAEEGKPMSAADGSSLSGTPSAASVKIGLGGKPAQTCNH
jgi:hypothetical protein